MGVKVRRPREEIAAQSGSGLRRPSACSPTRDLHPSVHGVTAPEPLATGPLLSLAGTADAWSPLPAEASSPCIAPGSPCGPHANIPLQLTRNTKSITATNVVAAFPIIVACIDMAVVMMHMYNASMKETRAKLAHRKKSKQDVEGNGVDSTNNAFARVEPDEDALQHPHEKQIIDLIR